MTIPTITIVLFKSKKLKNCTHPLMIRITQNRKSTYKSIGINCKLEEWDENKGKLKKNYPDRMLVQAIIDNKVSEYTTQLFSMIKDKENFSASDLITKIEKPSGKITLLKYIEGIIESLKSRGNIGNATAYKDTKRILNIFLQGKDVTFNKIDQSFLNQLENHLRDKGLSEVSISVYFRTLRAIYNRAIQENIITADYYPFKKYKISKFNTTTQKRAIFKSDIKKIESLETTPGTTLHLAKICFLFSYYGNGINFIDVANLKWSNLHEDRIYYTRAKTGQSLNFKLLDPALNIINHLKVCALNLNESQYIFPILDSGKHLTPQQKDNRIKKMRKIVNELLKQIAKTIGLQTSLTTYVARHTFATELKRNLIPTAMISEAMGHTSENTTRTYLKYFINSEMDFAMESIL